ncbi:HutD family protein [Clostridium sp. HBUAS56010]|uniref:HutD/Ves family protein n=1 Tax=Clostridium sp. HBUAS56010 TaxID=2571127 RepID=UPI0011786F35|nr:HutD family protein [Clostridium sp. HBUAS56010]
MDANIKILRKIDYKTTAWSGGDTTQIYIYPETAQYEEQDFLYRISLASVMEEVSSFTKLDNYNRILTVLEGSIKLEQQKETPLIPLKPLEQFQFGGEVPITSYGRCKDFNLMFQKGLEGKVQIMQMKETSWEFDLEHGAQYILYSFSGGFDAAFYEKVIPIQGEETLVIQKIRKPGNRLKIIRKDENTLLALCCIASKG